MGEKDKKRIIDLDYSYFESRILSSLGVSKHTLGAVSPYGATEEVSEEAVCEDIEIKCNGQTIGRVKSGNPSSYNTITAIANANGDFYWYNPDDLDTDTENEEPEETVEKVCNNCKYCNLFTMICRIEKAIKKGNDTCKEFVKA